jgi:transcriptional regulator with XRE-family HTH domain
MSKTLSSPQHPTLVQFLREVREASGVTQVELAKHLGRDQSSISLLERGQRRVDVIEFIRIAEALNIDPVELFASVVERIKASHTG